MLGTVSGTESGDMDTEGGPGEEREQMHMCKKIPGHVSGGQ